MYKSTDAGSTWQHLGLRDSQMIAAIAVDPDERRPVLRRGARPSVRPEPRARRLPLHRRRTDLRKVLFKDDYTSANEVLLDPRNPNIVYATLWPQQQSFIEGQGFGDTGMGIFKSTDGGTTWTQLTEGSAAHPAGQHRDRAERSERSSTRRSRHCRARGQGADRFLQVHRRRRALGPGDRSRTVRRGLAQDMRPLARIGGGDLPTVTVDPKDPNVVYTASTVMWRTMDGGLTWSAVRGAPGGDDYQRIWINPNDTQIILVVADQGAVVSANRGRSWSNWYNQNTAAMYHVTTDNAFPYRVCSGQQDSGSACVQSRSDDGRITFHDWHPVNIQEYGMAAPDPANPEVCLREPAHERVALRPAHGPDDAGRARHVGHAARRRRHEPQRADDAARSSRRWTARRCSTRPTWCGRASITATRWSRISPDLTRADVGSSRQRREVRRAP